MKWLAIQFFTTLSVLLPSLSAWGESQAKAPADTTQSETSSSPKHTVTIDIEQIMASYDHLEHQLANLLKEAEQFASEDKNKRQAIEEKKLEMRKIYRLDSPDYQRVAEEVAKAEGELSAVSQLKQEQFRRREGRLYYQAFQAIRKEISTFANEHNIALVLNTNQDVVDRDDPEAVERSIRERVVYQRNRDITNSILSELNDKQLLDVSQTRLRLGHRSVEALRASGLRFPFYRQAPIFFGGTFESGGIKFKP